MSSGEPIGDLDVRIAGSADGGVGLLSGDLDAAGAPTAALALRGATRGGVLPLTVDLTRLGHLASAGVKLLFDLADEAASVGNRLTVRVIRGSAAHHVLELTGFADLADLTVIDLAAAS
jgi:anti-anti-sigma regulatory factor